MQENITAAGAHVENRSSSLSWASVFAGAITVVASFWLLTLLGSAIGISIADGTDLAALTTGFGIASAIWIIVSGLISFYVGSYVAGRLAGVGGRTVGLLHGLVTWAVASIALVYLGYAGVSKSLQTVVESTQATASAFSSAMAQTSNLGQEAIAFAENQGIFDRVGAVIKEQAAAAAAEAEPAGSPAVTESELSQALGKIDMAIATRVGTELASGNTDAARSILADETNLTETEISSTVASIQNSVTSGESAATIEAKFNDAINTGAENLAAIAGPGVTSNELQRTLDSLNPSVIQTIGVRLLTGNVDGAKNTLIANTNLSRTEANTVIDSVEREVNAELQTFQNEAAQLAEQAGSYLQAAIWAAFITAVLALIASLVGGRGGAIANPLRTQVYREHDRSHPQPVT